jgi:hypothetical protein
MEILSVSLHLNCRLARHRGNCSPVRWTWTGLAGFWTEYSKIQRSLDNQHIAVWQVPISTQRQAPKFILWPSLTAKTRKLSFNRMQCRVVTDPLVGHNILRRHLYITGLIDSPLCRTLWSTGGNLSPCFMRVWSLGFTLSHLFGFLFLGPRGSEKSNSGGSLEL